MMVSGGTYGTYNGSPLTVELLQSTGNHLCFLPDLPALRYLHTQNGLEICGGGSGSTQTSCIKLVDGSWQQTRTLGQKRYGHTSWASPQGVLLMGGNNGQKATTTTEMLTDDGNTAASFTLANKRQYNIIDYVLFSLPILFYFQAILMIMT